MLQCISCSKQRLGDTEEESDSHGAQTSKESVKGLTSQIKDMVLKFSGVYRQCKPGGGPYSSTSYKKSNHQRPFYSYDDIAKPGVGGNGNHYPYKIGRSGGISSSTPAWDFTQFSTPAEAWGIPGGAKGEQVCSWVDPPVTVEDNVESKEWVAQVEPGVHITFLSLPQGGNILKRIRFSREMFNKWQAQRWWGENYDRILELYNVQRFNHEALTTPPRSEDERESTYSRVGSTKESPLTLAPSKDQSPCNNSSRAPTATSSNDVETRVMYFPVTAPAPDPTEHFLPQYQNSHIMGCGDSGPGKVEEASPIDVSRETTSCRDEPSVSISNDDGVDIYEWVEEDEPGVYITIRLLPDDTRELRRVRFSRLRFGEMHAKLWWEENRERIHAQYL